jgi:hypothetical protein
MSMERARVHVYLDGARLRNGRGIIVAGWRIGGIDW